MTTTPDNLEPHLRELTTSSAPETVLWQKALEQAAAGDAEPRPSILSRPLSQPLLAGLAACIVLVLAVGALLPSLGKARGGGPNSTAAFKVEGESWKRAVDAQDASNKTAPVQKPTYGGRVEGFAQLSGESAGQVRLREGHEFDHQEVAKDPATRQVIQKATIELQTPDVRAAFAKANHLVSAAGGEFVENTSLIGDGKSAQANLTLRVAAARLGEVLTQLRELGVVKSENTTGEDVTGQVVDLEARIRNEQRVEKELLELLDKRADAPLKDILELRNSLSSVRQSIEQYIGQRDRLGRLVSLASILVVIRAEPEAAPKPEPAQSIVSYFKNTAGEAWRDGLRTASDSLTWIFHVLVSGLLWWVVLASIVYAILRYRRRLAARCV